MSPEDGKKEEVTNYQHSGYATHKSVSTDIYKQ
jgi:hypothetical protein